MTTIAHFLSSITLDSPKIWPSKFEGRSLYRRLEVHRSPQGSSLCLISWTKSLLSWIFGRRQLKARTGTQDRIRAKGVICDIQEPDATSLESVKALIDACIAKHGRIDILFNIMGQLALDSLVSTNETMRNPQNDVNLKTTSTLVTLDYQSSRVSATAA